MRGFFTRIPLRLFGLVSVCLVGHVAWQQICPQQEEHTRELEKELWLWNGSHISIKLLRLLCVPLTFANANIQNTADM